MSAAEQALDLYFQLVEHTVFAGNANEAEQYLADAFELGRSLIGKNVSPDEVANLHHEAIMRLARKYPDIPLALAAERLMGPMMEMSMAYGLAFRKQMALHYEAMANARLQAMGMLATGIAHDFKNILCSIAGFAEMTGDVMADNAPEKKNIDWILISCQRAHSLIARMLAFVRHAPGKPVRLDMIPLIDENLAMLSALLDKGVEISFEKTVEHAFVMADPGQIQQIVMNLCINAADAIKGHGNIFLHLGLAKDIDGVPAGRESGICLAVADTGCGMPPEIQAKVFTPFFTTKTQSGGSGLGLSIVHGTVKELGGTIDIRSRCTEAKTGTEFRIFLPLAPEACQETESVPTEHKH